MSSTRLRRKAGTYSLLIPTILVLVVGMAYPLGRQLVLSFHELDRKSVV